MLMGKLDAENMNLLPSEFADGTLRRRLFFGLFIQ